jgi:tetratricopeptide (TPR) repeat protein
MIDRGDTLSAISRLKFAEIDFITDYNVFHLIKLYMNLFDLLSSINRQSEALTYLNRALKIAGDEEMISEQINILKKFNEYHQKSGNVQLLNKNLFKINELLEKSYQTDVTSLIQKIDTQHLIDEYKQKIKINELELEKSMFIRNGAIAASVFFFAVHKNSSRFFQKINRKIPNPYRQRTKTVCRA